MARITRFFHRHVLITDLVFFTVLASIGLLLVAAFVAIAVLAAAFVLSY